MLPLLEEALPLLEAKLQEEALLLPLAAHPPAALPPLQLPCSSLVRALWQPYPAWTPLLWSPS